MGESGKNRELEEQVTKSVGLASRLLENAGGKNYKFSEKKHIVNLVANFL